MTNEELKQFATVPSNQTLQRSIFNMSHGNKLTARVGDMIPYESIEILPGDTISEKQNQLLRGITPIFPTMDNAYVDFFFFFVPSRLCYLDNNYNLDSKIWQRINGENTTGFWKPQQETTAHMEQMPNIRPQSVLDYLDLPVGEWEKEGLKEEYNPALVVAYGLIYNEFFRDQNVEAPIQDWENFIKNTAPNECLKVAKFKDYFTSALPEPQKGDPVEISLGDEANLKGEIHTEDSLVHAVINGRDSGMYREGIALKTDGSLSVKQEMYGDRNEDAIQHVGGLIGSNEAHLKVNGAQFQNSNLITFKTNSVNLDTTKLKVDLSSAKPITINDLRLAFAQQRLLERDSRGGTRYKEILKSHWNITIMDETLQRPEYIGGKRIPLNIEQVNQTSASNDTTPLGFTGAYSLTTGDATNFVKSFKEHGYLIGIMCIRTQNTYKKGIPLKFTRKSRLDFYNPEFAHIGEQPIRNKELYLSTGKDSDKNNEIYGYKEAWAEYRYCESRLKGYFKTDDLTLKSWTYTQELGQLPTLNKDFITASREAFTKTLAVENPDYDYIVDIWHDMKMSRPLPVYSVPSLIDHD